MYKRETYRNIRDLIALSDEFKDNRSFNSWGEVFKKSLTPIIRKIDKFKFKSFNFLGQRYPYRVIKIFLKLLYHDLMHNNVIYVFNPKHGLKKQVTLRIASYLPDRNTGKVYTYSKVYFFFGGIIYGLYLDNKITMPKKVYSAGFYRRGRGEMIKLIKGGKRYYNSYKEKIFAEL